MGLEECVDSITYEIKVQCSKIKSVKDTRQNKRLMPCYENSPSFRVEEKVSDGYPLLFIFYL